MKIRSKHLFLLPLILCSFSLSLYSQTLPDGFFYDKRGLMVHQVGPDVETAKAIAGREGAFTAAAISAGVTEGMYYLSLFDMRPGKEGPVLGRQKDLPLTVALGNGEIIVNNDRYFRERKDKGMRVEILVYGISEGLFKEILNSKKAYFEVGKFEYLASADNLQAFKYLRVKMAEDNDRREFVPFEEMPDPARVLEGFYHFDGYYVKASNRKWPKAGQGRQR